MAKPIAYGPLALKPWEFGRLQSCDFYNLIEGYNLRQERKEDMLAYFVCCLMNVEGKALLNPISPAELLKPLRSEDQIEKRKSDEEYMKEKFKAVLEVKE